MAIKQYISSCPALLSEWDWEMNSAIGLYPENISLGSVKKIHWKCSLGHSWEASPNNRSRGQGCPICAGRKIQVGFNDLSSKHPQIAAEWHPIKNGVLLPTQVTPGSHKKVWWCCHECGNEWEATVSNRIAGKGCPICGRKKQGLVKEQNLVAQKGSFALHHPQLLKEWDYDKNDVDPYEITIDSTRKVWWRCHTCGYSWTTTVNHRTVRNSGCPACRHKVATSSNCLETTHPDILKKWDYERNQNISPRNITAGSSKKVWWICEEGHQWKAPVTSIVNGGMCPVCCGQQVQVGYNDLATVNPELAKEWHPTKNGDWLPTQFTAGSSCKKIWWLCPKGHEYQSTIASRSNGSGCPICEKERKTSFPEQAIFYYLRKITRAENRYLFDGKTEIDVYLPEYQIGIEYDGRYYHAGAEARLRELKKDALLLSKGISIIRVKEVKDTSSYQDSDKIIYCRNAGNYRYLREVVQKIIQRIPIHSNSDIALDVDIQRDASTIMSQYIQSEKENSLAAKFPEIAAEWHPTKNGYVTPEMVSYASGKKVWWLGTCGHEWSSVISNRIAGNGCPICANKEVLVGFNDLETTHPLLAKEWDYAKNGSLSPKTITFGSDKKVWWICANGHSYQSTVSNRYYGKNCPYCSNVKAFKGFNDLASQYPDIAKEWDYSKNSEQPDHVLPGSNKKIWWKCNACGHEWAATPNQRVYRHTGCPACSGRVATEHDNLLLANPELCKEWNTARNKKSPREYRPVSNQKVWWVCSTCGYEWIAAISDRSVGTGCPCCAGKKVLKGINDLATVHPQLKSEWNYEKNAPLLPETITSGTHRKVWWICSSCGYEWQASVVNRCKGHGCPSCGRKSTAASKEKPIYQYNSFGGFIREYSSIKAAENETNIKTISPSSEKKKTAGGFIWLLQKDDNKALKIASTIDQSRTMYKSFPVLQYSLDGEFIRRYDSSGEAERANGISHSKVGACCRGKIKTAGGYVWKYDINET